LADESSFTIEHIPEPSLALSIDAGKLSKQALVRDPICVGLSDQVGLKMEGELFLSWLPLSFGSRIHWRLSSRVFTLLFSSSGQAPFKIEYTVSSTHQDSHPRLHQRGSLGSVSSTTTFPLQTADPGHYTYEFLRIGDANYSPLTSGVTSLASSGRLLLEQEVFGRPSASFESNPTISLCSHGRLTPKSSKHQGNVILRGKAPFELEVAIRSPGSYSPTVRKVAIQSSRWSLDLPDYEFDHVGLYSIAIVSVKDATGCEQEVGEPVGQGQHQQPQLNSILVEVAETASVIPLLRVEDVCVGSELSFLLQGSPPWQLE
jgi:nucleoporin POM152